MNGAAFETGLNLHGHFMCTGQYAFLHVHHCHVSYQAACIVRAHSTSHGYPTHLAVVLLVRGEYVNASTSSAKWVSVEVGGSSTGRLLRK